MWYHCICASTSHPALARTVVYDSQPLNEQETATANLAQQELAGRMLLTRRQLMDRVEQSLRPLFRGQVLQVLIGVALVLLGVQCWARNTQIPHRVVNGVILHVYGVIVISQALLVCTRASTAHIEGTLRKDVVLTTSYGQNAAGSYSCDWRP